MDRDKQHEPASAQELAAVMAALRMKLGAAAARFPETVSPHEPDLPSSFPYAIEVRSCPQGDLYLRFDDEGNVVFGRDLFRRFTVDQKLLDPVRQGLRGLNTDGKPTRILGPVTCDFERLQIRWTGEWRTLVIGMGRHEPSVAPLEAALLEVIRRTRGEEMAAEHVRRMTPFTAPAGSATRADSRADSRPAGPGR
jgi:hypothetical protein